MAKQAAAAKPKQEIPPCKGNLYQRIIAVMQELKDVRKEDKRVNGQFRYISFNQVYQDVKPLFIKHGIVNYVTVKSWQQDGNMATLVADVVFTNADNPEEQLVETQVGQGISGNRNGTADDKSCGKALSYLHKNAICKLLLLGGSEKEEVDSDAAVEHKPKGKAPKSKQTGPAPQLQPQAPAPQPIPAGGPQPNPFQAPQQQGQGYQPQQGQYPNGGQQPQFPNGQQQ